MGKRLAPVVAALALLLPAASYALGLGGITMKSALNEPLNAEIELLSVQDKDLDQLVVRLGTPEDFARVGTERAFFLTKIKFDLATRPDGTPVVKLSSTDLVTEPFLDFVVEARWPRGRILREFTVLVDPPVLSKAAPAPMQQAVTTAAPAAAPAQQRQAPIPERAQLTPVLHRDGVLSYGPVKANDTLWEIANQMRPDESVTVNQMMTALVRNNPNAFYNGNVNQLKAGYVLRLEDRKQITTLSTSEADAEIERQRVEWNARKSGRLVKQTTAAGGQAMAAAGEAGAKPAAAGKPQLKLMAPGQGETGSGAGGEEVDQLRKDILLAAEALDANRQETEELKSRLADMEAQLAAMQKLITLKDNELLTLQNQMGKAPGEKTAVVAEQEIERLPAIVDEPVEEAEATTPESATQMAPAEEPAKKPAAKPVAEPEPVEEAGLLDDPLLLYGVLGVVVLALVGLVIVRRRRMQDGFQESILNVGNDTAELHGVNEAMVEGGESSMVSDFAMSSMSDMSGIQADSADVDPVSEADVYLAYGRYQQAEDIIREAMDKTPDRHELRLKLLEIYFAAKNSDAFEKQAQELHDLLGDESDPLWARAVTMGSQLCPGSELFGGAVAHLKEELGGAVTADEDDLLDFDFDLDADDLGTAKSPAAVTAGEEVADLDFDLDLDSTTATTEEADAGLDFDLGLDEQMAEPEEPAEPAVAEEPAPAAAASQDTALDFDVSSLDYDLDQNPAEAPVAETAEEGLDFDMEGLNLDETSEEEAIVAADEALDFDMGDLAMDTETGEAEPDTLNMEVDTETETALEGLAETEEAVIEGLEEESLGDELLGEDVFSSVDEVGTKLDLAKAYIDMGDSDGARGILDEVLEEGDDEQKQQAQELLAQMS